ncbi:glucuronate isomerase [Flexithrix dorotheae]|uniref:glucuronate isomerase n=1 Tax=Flexithrix dorotheae TaxID=70993 RepID=UPI00038099BE|nr:glucuronate isomerase [Flexithrix dorotheae]
MKKFLDENFVLETATAQKLYREHAKDMPIIDYHCHLSPEDIANDRQFKNLYEIWLEGDHYKWRAMRTNGVDESFCTGDKSPYEKFEKWAETVPYTMRNPLYHWTHMELKAYFGVEKLLNKDTAKEIYEHCSALLNTPEYSVRNLLRKMKVKVVCTTDDPADTLEFHQKIKDDGFEVKVLPTFRADKAMAIEDANAFIAYIEKLGETAGMKISSYKDLKNALRKRHDFFHEMGGRLSDHGLEHVYASKYNNNEIKTIFNKALIKAELKPKEITKFKSAMLVFLAEMDHEKGWTQQFHLGALRNNSSRMMRELGPDTGFDSIGDFEMAKPLSKFLDRLDNKDKLAKTILYNLNPRDNYLMGTMTGNFNDGSTPGKIQFGTGWWFLDQKEAMEWQMNALSNLGLLSRFVGMLTDSRSFMSFPRHDYFRRILCNLLGNDIENGLLPEEEMKWIGKIVEDVCYNNANEFFGF